MKEEQSGFARPVMKRLDQERRRGLSMEERR
jgi:hypothetical protein